MRFIMSKFQTIRILSVYVIKGAHVNHLSVLIATARCFSRVNGPLRTALYLITTNPPLNESNRF